jgi:uncharacterized 2Fe-2S/4Fe-4S cluster protein (DUF4445 family)
MGEIEKKYNIKKISCEALKKLAQYAKIHHPERILNLVIFKEEIIDIRIDTDQDIYGFAIDIGSTTVAGYLYNMGTMELIGTYSSLNRQTALGADVISRIGYTIRNENGLDVLRQKIYDTINDLIAGAEADGFPSQNQRDGAVRQLDDAAFVFGIAS